MALLSTPGLGAGVAISIALLVNLTLTPTLLLTFRNFFFRSTFRRLVGRLSAGGSDQHDRSLLTILVPLHCPLPSWCRLTPAEEAKMLRHTDEEAPLLESPRDSVSSINVTPESKLQPSGLWYRYGQFLMKPM